jgi:hypothetical protein
MHQTYDPRLRNAVARSGNPNLFPKLLIPRTTAETWIRDGVKEFVTDPVFEICNSSLAAKVIQLEFELAQKRAKVVLLKSAPITTGFSMQYVPVATAQSLLSITFGYSTFAHQISTRPFSLEN